MGLSYCTNKPPSGKPSFPYERSNFTRCVGGTEERKKERKKDLEIKYQTSPEIGYKTVKPKVTKVELIPAMGFCPMCSGNTFRKHSVLGTETCSLNCSFFPVYVPFPLFCPPPHILIFVEHESRQKNTRQQDMLDESRHRKKRDGRR